MNVELARWKFGFVTVNHFFFVPVTIGLAFLTALLQTAWYHTKRDEYLRLTRYRRRRGGVHHLDPRDPHDRVLPQPDRTEPDPHQYGRKLTWQPIKLTRW
jgi:hypothetical protein